MTDLTGFKSHILRFTGFGFVFVSLGMYDYITPKERRKMISTALAIQNAAGDAVVDFSTLLMAKSITKNREDMTEEEFIHALWEYSAHISSLTATLVTSACLTKSQLSEMIDTIKEMDELGKEAL